MYSDARNLYYNIGAFPTVYFDGVLQHEGASGNMYNTYLAYVNQRNAIPSDFIIDIELEKSSLDYTATVVINNIGGNTSSNLILQFTITESYLPISWGYGETVNSVNRMMVPNQNGTPINFSSGDVQTVELNFSIEEYWDIENCEIIAFIQSNTTKEIKQGTKKFLEIPLYDIDVEANSINHPQGIFCGNSLEPVITIKNKGAENLVSCDIEYSINEGEIEIYTWTGDLGFKLEQEVELDEIEFEPGDVNIFEFSVSNPNGQLDPNTDNNTMSAEFESAAQLSNEIVLFELKTDYYPSETTWEVTNSGGDVIYSGGPYGSAQTLYNETWEFELSDCYTFTIFDSQGDGICCSFGTGYYKLMDSDSLVFAEGGQFASSDYKPFVPYVENILIADFVANTTSVIEGESVNFSDLSSGVITEWFWEFEGGEPATSNEQFPTVVYNTEGLYNVSLTISDGNNSNTVVKEDYIEVDHITGISDMNITGVQIYPNPTDGKVFFNGVEDATINVYNSAGTIVSVYKKSKDQSIDMSNLNDGIYFIQILTENEIISKKVNLIK